MELIRPGESMAASLARNPAMRAQFHAALSEGEALVVDRSYRFWRRPSQAPPPGHWTFWMLSTGRGFGKTWVLSNWAHAKADLHPGSHGALCSRTIADVRDTLVIGLSGLVATQLPWNPCEYVKADRIVRWRNGSTAHLYSSEEPDQLRGPNHHWGVGDEVASWKPKKAADGQTALDHLRFSTRVRFAGYPPQLVLGSTPRRTPTYKALLEQALTSPGGRLTRGHMRENIDNLAPEFVNEIERLYVGTRLGRQELAGELVDAVEGAILGLDLIDSERREIPMREGRPDLSFLDRVVVGVDPSGGRDEQGIVAVGRAPKCPCGNGAPMPHGWVLEDATGKRTPEGWGGESVRVHDRWRADRIAGERNYGGDMVRHVIRTSPGGARVRYVDVTASRGKHVRAEPVLGLYEQRRMHHAIVPGRDPAHFALLEDELCGFTPYGYGDAGSKLPSPNRADAAVWAASAILLGGAGGARVS